MQREFERAAALSGRGPGIAPRRYRSGPAAFVAAIHLLPDGDPGLSVLTAAPSFVLAPVTPAASYGLAVRPTSTRRVRARRQAVDRRPLPIAETALEAVKTYGRPRFE